jgi:hypothetical protein
MLTAYPARVLPSVLVLAFLLRTPRALVVLTVGLSLLPFLAFQLATAAVWGQPHIWLSVFGPEVRVFAQAISRPWGTNMASSLP